MPLSGRKEIERGERDERGREIEREGTKERRKKKRYKQESRGIIKNHTRAHSYADTSTPTPKLHRQTHTHSG